MYRYIVYTSLDKRDLRLLRVLLLFNIFRQSGAHVEEGEAYLRILSVLSDEVAHLF